MDTNQAVNTIREKLFALRDEKYASFSASLVPNVERERFIGVRTPLLRSLAKELCGTEEARLFMAALPHYYQEENCLHGFLAERIKDEGELYAALDAFLPHVTNWAVCDLISPALFKKRPASLMPKIDEWLKSGDVYAVRFGLGMLMAHYLDAPYFTEDVLERAAGVTSGEYYLKMMVAWLFATALAKQYDAALPYIKDCRLDAWTHNKAIQKAIESRRVTDGHKAELRALKIK